MPGIVTTGVRLDADTADQHLARRNTQARRLQFRWETYNTFNHTQYTGVDTTARFDAAGNQINTNLGRFTSAALGRRMVLALKFYF